MTGRPKIWQVGAALFAVMNLGGAGYAAAIGEPLHAAAHVALLIATYLVWRLAARPRALDLAGPQLVEERLEHLQQSLDAIALEVERIGEAQRFLTKLQAERAESSPRKPS